MSLRINTEKVATTQQVDYMVEATEKKAVGLLAGETLKKLDSKYSVSQKINGLWMPSDTLLAFVDPPEKKAREPKEPKEKPVKPAGGCSCAGCKPSKIEAEAGVKVKLGPAEGGAKVKATWEPKK